jgi:Rha family phage regulatory protein
MTELTKTEIHLERKDRNIYASSLEIAERFGKQHKDVLRKIESLLAELAEVEPEIKRFGEIESWDQRNFAPITYIDDRNRPQTMYLVTEQGFALLALSFTGKEALVWKIKYIQAFEDMRNLLGLELEKQQNQEWEEFKRLAVIAYEEKLYGRKPPEIPRSSAPEGYYTLRQWITKHNLAVYHGSIVPKAKREAIRLSKYYRHPVMLVVDEDERTDKAFHQVILEEVFKYPGWFKNPSPLPLE